MENLKRYTIIFDPVPHSYTIKETGEKCTSVTQKLGLVTPPFDTWKHATNYAKKYGFDAAYWVEEWARINKEACDNGTYHHDNLEEGIDDFSGGRKTHGFANSAYDIRDAIKGFKIDAKALTESPLKDQYPKIYNRLVCLVIDGWELYTERIVYWYDYLITGKVDLIALKVIDGIECFLIIDWKTNKDHLHDTPGYYKKHNGVKTDVWIEKWESLKPPLAHLPHTKKMIYNLQFSMYATILELWGLKCMGLELWHIIDGTELKYTLPFLKYDSLTLFSYNPKLITKNKYNINNV